MNQVDRGAATIWAAGGIAAVLVVMTLLLGFGSATVTRHRAASAADLAALAAAAHAISGQERACTRARWVTDRMQVQLTGCRLRGWEAFVEVAASPPSLIAGFGRAEARAHAGPVERSSHHDERHPGAVEKRGDRR